MKWKRFSHAESDKEKNDVSTKEEELKKCIDPWKRNVGTNAYRHMESTLKKIDAILKFY